MKTLKHAAALTLVGLTLASCGSGQTSGAPAIPKDKAIENKVESVLKTLTLEEKAGQMVQLTSETFCTDGLVDTAKVRHLVREYKIGSFLNMIGVTSRPRAITAEQIKKIQDITMDELGIPMIYGLDMIHGATYLDDATFYPQEVNLAATFDRSYANMMGKVIAYESRAAMTPWVFSPVMDLSRNPCWPRVWESWGEDPYLQSEMSVAETVGAQGHDPNHIGLENVAVSIKHYLGYGATASGKDRTPAYVAPDDLREKYFRPFKDCMQAGALTLMVNSASINGVPVHASHEYLTEWAKEQLGWDGLAVTDWADINNLYTREHIAANRVEAVAAGINAGIDMIMDPYDPEVCKDIITAVNEKMIPMSRIDDAVRRVLRLKARLGLFENPVWDVDHYDKFACKGFQANAYEAAVESMVLLKNEDNVLPIQAGKKILVTGPNANSMRTLNGGWSYTWQGDADNFASHHNTILEALKNVYGEKNVSYVAGVNYDMTPMMWDKEINIDIDAAVRAARNADIIVACIGENSYCETPGNINDLNLSSNQKELVKRLAKTGKPIVMVLNEGRPRIINDIEPLAKAVVDIMLPGNYGGDALASLIAGKENFSGRLPFTYSKYVNSLHTYDYKVSENVQTMGGLYNYDATMDVQWPFGAGLSYTSFEYSDLKSVSPVQFNAGDLLSFEVTVKNTGNVKGKESVLLFSSDIVASKVPDVKRLRQFTKVELNPGESKTVRLEFPAHELAFVGHDGKWRLEKGEFRIACGTESMMIVCTATKVWDTPNID
ncbi:MAG: glycoside hydrolase family 3 N-terminal domain-containing protein [Candidatus Cryptobacteroides sp.]|nr:glycoside hydrolase family 3 N-terminal domain-containing protein [Candidatus Cryptobacteroides sp.]